MAALPNPSQYQVTRPGLGEGIVASLYDYQAYASAGQTSLTFFQTPLGQSSKTLADTNMKAAGQLSAGNTFVVQGIEVYLFPGVLPTILTATTAAAPEFSNDIYTVAKSGWLNMQVLDKSYVTEAPIGRFPPRSRLQISTSAATTIAAGQLASDYAAFAGNPYPVSPNITLQPNMAFNVTLNWPTAVSLPSGADARIGVVLTGILYRQSQ